MKPGNRGRRPLSVGAVGGGLLCAVVEAAPLDTNLIVNPGFESVDLGTVGGYGAPRILNWAGMNGFAYSHQPGATGVPDYANGGPLAGGGNWYFTSNNSGDIDAPGEFFQDISVSTGPSATAIAAGRGRYDLGAFMSAYLAQGDFGNVHADFRNGSGQSIGSVLISDSDPSTWTLNSGSGLIPAGTAMVRLSVYGTASAGGPDGYIDNVSFRVLQSASAAGDFNGDGAANAADIDLLGAAIRAGGPANPYDLNSDSLVNKNDLNVEVLNIIGTRFGDSDTDGDVDLVDLGNLATGFQQPGAKWSRGDFDVDLDVDLSDLGTLATNFGLGRDQAFVFAQALGVPEPSVIALAGLGLFACARKERRT